jgi:hypothetical protein
MAPAIPADSVHASSASLSLTVTGGKETSAAGASQISNADFSAALRHAIEQSKLFARSAEAGAGDYHLEVLLARLQQPMFGFSMTVTLEASWTLTRRSDQTIVWQKSIESTYTASTGDAFAGVKRLRLATEGAAKENIAQALQAIAGLKLP